MLKKANINWSVKQYKKMMEKGTVTFDNSIQRGYVWDVRRKSLLIHSILVGYPIPPFYATKNTETKQYDMLDGKQRSNAIAEFLNDKFCLTDIPSIPYEDEDGEIVDEDFNDVKFSNLPELLRDEIESYSLLIYYYEDITDEEVNEMFFRLNNGRALSAIEINRAKAKSFDRIREIGQHEFLRTICTDSDLNRYKNEDIVIKTYIMLSQEEPCLDSKNVRQIISENEITDIDEHRICKVFDKLNEVYPIVKVIDTAVAKRLRTLTHLVSIVQITETAIEDELTNEEFANFLVYFFTGEPSVSEEYNDGCRSGSNHLGTIRHRLDAIQLEYNKYEAE